MGTIRMELQGQGLQALEKQFDLMMELGPSKLAGALAEGGEILLQGVREAAPERSGALKKGLNLKTRGGIAPSADVRSEAPHAWLVEHGHGGPKPAPAHPFLNDAVDRNRKDAEDAVAAAVFKMLGL